jgi:dTDP-4-amino-4,6-dideoxygalactose transaminase
VNQWTGHHVVGFEREFAAWLDIPHAVAVANGTVTIEMALRAFGVGPGHEVITTPRTFVGTATAILAVGATPVFADVDRDSQLITADTVARVVTRRTRAILPVHLAGWTAELDELMDLAESHNLKIIEDCAQSHGARYRGRMCGTIGHVGSFSFCQDKILTTGGEGGLLCTDDETLYRALWSMKDHGKSYEAVFEREHPPGFRWLVESPGTNLRMTEMQAAVGRSVLPRLDDQIARRRAIARRLCDGLADVRGLRIPTAPDHIEHSYYRFYAFVEPDALAAGWDRDRIVAAISAEGIPAFQGSCSEIYLEKVFEPSMRPPSPLPVARELGETSIMLLSHPTLDDATVDDMITAVSRVMAAATR